MQLFKVKGNYKSGFAGETHHLSDTSNTTAGANDQSNLQSE